MEEKKEEVVEGEQVGDFVKYVEIRYGINEDGGGVQIIVRDDESDAKTLTNLALRILREINGKGGKEWKDRAKGNEVV